MKNEFINLVERTLLENEKLNSFLSALDDIFLKFSEDQDDKNNKLSSKFGQRQQGQNETPVFPVEVITDGYGVSLNSIRDYLDKQGKLKDRKYDLIKVGDDKVKIEKIKHD